MRVVIFGAEHSMTGANLLMCRWAEHRRGQGHDVSMLPAEEGTGPLSARYAAAGVKQITRGQVFVDRKTLVICNTVLAAEMVISCAPFSDASGGSTKAAPAPKFSRARRLCGKPSSVPRR